MHFFPAASSGQRGPLHGQVANFGYSEKSEKRATDWRLREEWQNKSLSQNRLGRALIRCFDGRGRRTCLNQILGQASLRQSW
jgi:hypothetical protein